MASSPSTGYQIFLSENLNSIRNLHVKQSSQWCSKELNLQWNDLPSNIRESFSARARLADQFSAEADETGKRAWRRRDQVGVII
jgi:hypothetical protein